MRGAGLLLFVVAVLLGLAGPAHARIAFERGAFVYVARDDGSGVKRLARGSDPTERHDLVAADWASGKRTTLIRNAMWGSWTG